MNLKLKIWLSLGFVMLLLHGLFSVIDYRRIDSQARETMHNQALNVRALLMATRRVYHRQFLASGLPVDDHTLGFLPAHALSRISVEYKNWARSGVHFNNVSDRPRNPANRADASELAAMAWHRAHPKAEEHVSVIREADGRDYFHYTAPIWTEAYCLECHASPESAPKGVRVRYDEAYGYRLGDLRGVMSIKLPVDELRADALHHWWRDFWERIALLLTVLLVLAWLLNRLVTRRVDALVEAVDGMAAGDYSRQIDSGGRDELDKLGTGFNRMADAVRKRDQALAESEVQARTLAELAPVGIFRTDRLGHCTYVNGIWESISGMTEAESLGMGWTRALHPADRDRVGAAWRASIESGQPFHQEYRFLKADAAVTWVLGQAHGEFDAQGRLIGYIGSITDISERKRAEEMEYYGAFQAGIAEMATSVLHNIGNAITAVTHDADALVRAARELDRVADLLATNARQSGEQLQAGQTRSGVLVAQQCAVQDEAARVIAGLCRDELEKRSQRIAIGVNHVADIVRIQQNAALPSSHVSSFSLSQAIASALSLQAEAIEKSGIQVVVDVPDALDLVTLSHNRLLQILINAIKNSVEAIRERLSVEPLEGRIVIAVTSPDPEHLCLSVADNGAGVDPALRDKLFRFGFSTKQRGSGFGLHGMALFAQEAGGSVRLESPGPGQGAELVMTLPRSPSLPTEPR